MNKLAVALVLALCPPLSAQASIGGGQADGSNYSLDGASGNQPYGLTAVADLDGDLLRDTAIIVGAELHVLFAPGLYEALVSDVHSGVRDVVGLEASGSGAPEAFVVAADDGVHVIEWDGTARDFVKDPVSSSAALHVERGRPTTSGNRTIAVAFADGSLARFENVGSAWSIINSIPVGTAYSDFRLADYDGDGDQEYVFLVQEGVVVMEPNGSGSQSKTYSTALTQRMCVLSGNGDRQWIAVALSNSSGGVGFLAVIGQVGGGSLTTLDFDSFNFNPQIVGLSSDDTFDPADGLGDIVVSHQSFYEIGYLKNIGNDIDGPRFDPALTGAVESVDTGMIGSAPDNFALVAVGDYDNDSDPDALLPISADRRLFVFKSGRTEEGAYAPDIVRDTVPGQTLEYAIGSNGKIEFHARIEIPDLASTFDLGSPNALEMITYQRDSPDGSLDTAPIDIQLVPVDPVGAGNQFFDVVIELEEDAENNCTHYSSLYFIVLRLVEADLGTGTVQQRFPARLFAIEGSETQENIDFIMEHSPNEEPGLYIPHDCDSGVQPGNGGPGAGALGGQGGQSEKGSSGDELPCLPGPSDGPPQSC